MSPSPQVRVLVRLESSTKGHQVVAYPGVFGAGFLREFLGDAAYNAALVTGQIVAITQEQQVADA